jgi:hypothetical protein
MKLATIHVTMFSLPCLQKLGARLVQAMDAAADAAGTAKAAKDYYEGLDKLSEGGITSGVRGILLHLHAHLHMNLLIANEVSDSLLSYKAQLDLGCMCYMYLCSTLFFCMKLMSTSLL